MPGWRARKSSTRRRTASRSSPGSATAFRSARSSSAACSSGVVWAACGSAAAGPRGFARNAPTSRPAQQSTAAPASHHRHALARSLPRRGATPATDSPFSTRTENCSRHGSGSGAGGAGDSGESAAGAADTRSAVRSASSASTSSRGVWYRSSGRFAISRATTAARAGRCCPPGSHSGGAGSVQCARSLSIVLPS